MIRVRSLPLLWVMLLYAAIAVIAFLVGRGLA